MQTALLNATAQGVTHVIFGDLFLEDVRAYREAKMAGTGVAPVFPLWGRPTDQLAHGMIDVELKIYLVCIDLKVLAKYFAGQKNRRRASGRVFS